MSWLNPPVIFRENEDYRTPTVKEIVVGLEYEYKTHDGIVHPKDELDAMPWQTGVILDENDIPYVVRSLTGRNAEHSWTVRVKK